MFVRIILKSTDTVLETIPAADAVARINELSGRTSGAYVLDQARKNGRRSWRDSDGNEHARAPRCYVACNREGSFRRRLDPSRGFIIEIVR